MFSRNEKYGQALHLQYGSKAAAQKSRMDVVPSVLARLTSYIVSAKNVTAAGSQTMPFETPLDEDFINQAVQCELRNTAAAANENRPAAQTMEIA